MSAPLEHIIKFKVQCKKNNCINLVKDRWADTLRHLQHGRKRKSPRLQNRHRSEIWGKSTAIFRNKNSTE